MTGWVPAGPLAFSVRRNAVQRVAVAAGHRNDTLLRHDLRVPTLRIAQDAADDRLSRDPLALLIGMLLDQHMRGRSDERVALAGAMIR